MPACAAAAAAAPSTTARSSACPTGANLRERSRGRRASCPEANLPSRYSQARRGFNQLPGKSDDGTMRETLEDQHRAATMVMAGTSKVRFTLCRRSRICTPCLTNDSPTFNGYFWYFSHPCPFRSSRVRWMTQEETAAVAQAMTVLGTPANSASRGGSQRVLSQRSPSPQAASAPAVYSLVDFIAAPGKKKSSQRVEGSDRDSQKVGKVWGEEAVASESGATGAPLSSGRSFHEILQEEEREKKKREEYGESVWFVSGKPRSTSFEGIVQQQRREERVAEEERLRQLEEEMLGLALEISKQEAQSTPSTHPHGKGNREGRRTRHRKDARGATGKKQASRTQRSHRTTRADDCSKSSGGVEAPHVQGRNGHSRKGSTTGAGQAELKLGTSAP